MGKGCHRQWIVVLLGVALGAQAGCGTSNPLGRKAVSGTVTLDGAPLASGSIEFTPLGGGVSSGAVIDGGKYEIPAESGLPPGKYRVSIVDNPPAAPLPPGHMPGDDLPPQPKPRVPASWNQNSTHEVEVTEQGPNRFDFSITTKAR
jgi:hypothetical protein